MMRSMKTQHQFVLLSSDPIKEARFQALKVAIKLLVMF